jgi:glycosyltransferase involved in cell wall biosynthesis
MPFFSVIVPTYNRPTRLNRCLQALAAQTYPREKFEVIVVDDESPTPLAEVTNEFAAKLDVTLISQPRSGPGAARNLGAARARGEFLAFTDDDCEPAPDWLSNLAARFEQTPTHLVGGHTVNGVRENIYSETSQVLLDVVYTHYNLNRADGHFFATNNVALPAEQFRAIGGFEPSFRFAEDRELCDRWLHHGSELTYAQEVVVRHLHQLSLGKLWWQHFKYGCGAYRFHHLRAQRGWGRFRPEGSFYSALFRSPFHRFQGVQALQVEALLFVTQVANAVGFFWQAARGYHRPPS